MLASRARPIPTPTDSLKSGYVRHIRHWQSRGNQLEQERLKQQEPTAVDERLKRAMPSQQKLRRIRSEQLVRNGLTARLASSALAGALGACPAWSRLPQD